MLSNKRKFNKKTIFYLSLFWPFLAKKTAKNEENWQNPNRWMKFSEILYVVASQQKKMLQKTVFRFRHFLAFLLAKKQPKLIKKNE